MLLFTYFFIAYLICLYAYLCNRWYSCLVALLNHVHLTLIDRLTLIDLVTIWIQLNPAARFQFHVFTFFFSCTWTVTLYGFTVQGTKIIIHALFITVHALKNIKNGSHGTIYTFKNYFATVLSVFSFSNNKLNPNGLLFII